MTSGNGVPLSLRGETDSGCFPGFLGDRAADRPQRISPKVFRFEGTKILEETNMSKMSKDMRAQLTRPDHETAPVVVEDAEPDSLQLEWER